MACALNGDLLQQLLLHIEPQEVFRRLIASSPPLPAEPRAAAAAGGRRCPTLLHLPLCNAGRSWRWRASNGQRRRLLQATLTLTCSSQALPRQHPEGWRRRQRRCSAACVAENDGY